MEQIWKEIRGNSPLVATAIHDGHMLRPEIVENMALTDDERLREEDPFTAIWTQVSDNRLIGTHSRFEVDLNRPREKAVYIQPEDAWGLHVWKETPSTAIVNQSLANYDAFYAETHRLFTELERNYGHFVVYDLHTYNHRRDGAKGAPADPTANPEVNIGTGTLNRDRWGTIIDCFIEELSAFDFLGRQLDVRENVKFRGGQLARWTHENFPESGCVMSIEFKKFFMDEWTGIPNKAYIEEIGCALQATTSVVRDVLRRI